MARSVAREYRDRGATSVVLGGSWARGDAHRESDLDVWVFGMRTGGDLLWRPPFMVVVDRRSVRAEERRLRTPPHIGGSVPGWRVARPLHDPHAIARRLRAEARRFQWSTVRPKCDRWVAEQVVRWAEEAIKLVRALATGNFATAAVQRNLLAEGLGFVIAIHRHWFWDSENEAWERIGRAVGGTWGAAQRAALGIPRGSVATSCQGALALYGATAEEIGPLLRPDERAIVANACRVAGVPGPATSRPSVRKRRR